MSDVFRDLYNELIEMGGANYIRFVSCPVCEVYYMWLALADGDNEGIEGFIEVARGTARFPACQITPMNVPEALRVRN